MNLFILGATGGTGSEVVGQALERGHNDDPRRATVGVSA
jgi:uncharacterized protein YbjT (DUF2867 family)